MKAKTAWLLLGWPALALAEPGARPQSVVVVARDEPIWAQPRVGSARRGAALLGTRLPVYASARGAGCASSWLWVGPSAWICADRTQRSSSVPRSSETRDPVRHFFVGPNGSLGYRTLATAEEGPPDAEYDPGFAVSLVMTRDKLPGQSFGLTRHGLWLPLEDLTPAAEPPGNGQLLHGTLDVGWVVRDEALLYALPGKTRVGKLPRLSGFRVLERRSAGGRRFLRIGERAWINESDARLPTAGPAPAGASSSEHWIDLELERQVLVAYAGSVPVFAALVSTGKGPAAGPFATPKGEFRIWVKLRTSDMTNLEDDDANGYYAIEDVPWVMFFHRGYGLHGAFWHRAFGRVRSHGCVNLAPDDAKWLFDWTSPKLPAGWSAVLPTSDEPGTLVRVR